MTASTASPARFTPEEWSTVAAGPAPHGDVGRRRRGAQEYRRFVLALAGAASAAARRGGLLRRDRDATSGDEKQAALCSITAILDAGKSRVVGSGRRVGVDLSTTLPIDR